jgi:predicted Zn-dependent protease
LALFWLFCEKTITLNKLRLLLSVIVIVSFSACSKTDITASDRHPENNKQLGASAHDILSASAYQSVIVQVHYMPGYQPDPAALDNFYNFLNSLVNKPGGITISQSQVAASGKSVLSLNDVIQLENTNRSAYTNGTRLAIYLLFTDAVFTESNVLGIAYKNTSMVVFGKKVHENSGGLNQVSRTKLETTIEEHEIGHILGLVDLGSPMQVNHKDPPSNHCNNSSCLMYFQTQINMIGGITSPVPELDTNCRNDLRANGGR